MVKIHLWPISTLLVYTGIVHTELDNFAKAPALLPVVDNYTNTTSLCTLDSLAQGEDKIWPAAADVTAEDIRTDAFVVYTHDCLCLRIANLPCVTEGVDGATAYCGDVSADLWVEEGLVLGELEERLA